MAIHGTLLTENNVPSACFPLYAAGIAWTMVYDTIYAHQDKQDDVVVGIKSTALLFGDRSTVILAGFSALMTLSLTVTGYMAAMPWPFYVVSVGGTTAHLAWQLATTRWHDAHDCGRTFASNRFIGWIVLSGILASYAADHRDTPVAEPSPETVA
jgi:4-hydroxybenzoate polyprenyltransferase